jgi:hypothetical protein
VHRVDFWMHAGIGSLQQSNIECFLRWAQLRMMIWNYQLVLEIHILATSSSDKQEPKKNSRKTPQYPSQTHQKNAS